MSVKYALLGILAEEDRHGYDLKEVFQERVGDFWTLNYGQIYRTLDRLERDGLVQWHEEPQERRPDRKVYRITPKGERELSEWLTRPVEGPRPLRDELFIKMLFLSPKNRGDIANLIERQKDIYLTQMQHLTERKFELSQHSDRDRMLVSELLMDAALFHAEADVRWLDHCAQKLRLAQPRSAQARK